MAEMVLIGCKSPLGYVLNLQRYEVLAANGIVRRVGDLATVTLRGNAYRQGEQPDPSTNGYVFTSVPKDFWEAWLVDHADFPPLLDGFILAAKSDRPADQKAMAAERASEPGQNDRLNPAGDRRTKGMGIETADEQNQKRLATA